MAISNFRKESSERSDSQNWAKNALSSITNIRLESIEGCNQNASNKVTHLIERARVDYSDSPNAVKSEVIEEIKKLEGIDSLQRKINFSNAFGIPLTYALYCDEVEKVFLIQLESLESIEFVSTFNSYSDFSAWIQGVKGWVSRKSFREIKDLPYFDIQLRKAGCAWPTNIDCFVSDENNNPIAIVEFQNAKRTKVKDHCNNDFFLCKMSSTNQFGNPKYHDDIRRWVSQEILRVQSNLRFFIITWSQNEPDFIIKELEIVTVPYFPEANGKPDWATINSYKKDMNHFVNQDKPDPILQKISNSYKTYNLVKKDESIDSVLNEPPLSYGAKTFPSLYYHSKVLVQDSSEKLPVLFSELLGLK